MTLSQSNCELDANDTARLCPAHLCIPDEKVYLLI
jgi:hypothetical protein